MKTNLDKFFKNSKDLESQGIWMDISEGVGFLVKRFGGYNSEPIKKAMAKYYKPYAKQIEMGTLSQEKSAEIMFRVFVEACVINWQGIEIDGEKKPFSVDDCVKLFCQLPELGDAVVQYSSDSKSYREELGNS